MEREKFKLLKCKPTTAGLDIIYQYTAELNETRVTNKHHVSMNETPQNEIFNLFEQLMPIVADIFTISVIDALKVDAVAISGKVNGGLIINATYTNGNRKGVIRTPRLSLFEGEYADQLNEIITNLEIECFEYVVNGKRGEMADIGEFMDGGLS